MFLTEAQGPIPARFNALDTPVPAPAISRDGYSDWLHAFREEFLVVASGVHDSFILEARTTKDGAQALFKRIYSMVNGGILPPPTWVTPDAEGVRVENFTMATLMTGNVSVRM